jgi:HPt (histidine-containing phosphotransfer) domain-containing protein
MSRMRAYFVQEALDCLETARSALVGDPDLDAVYGAVRRLRGSAQMARFGELAETALALERRLRPAPGRPEAATLERVVRDTLEVLAIGVEAVRNGELEEDTEPEDTMDEQAVGGTEVAGGEVVALETLEYRGERALERAVELRGALENAIVSDEPSGPILDELFDLIRLGAQ